jgi:hypothetical protein
MTVRLDAGRTVAFDLKDYAHLDHGYAATIHKAQGMTVDRVHVLATPGLDRHAAYVALSRHRDSVDLHYGRDDFADDASLARVLSRDRSKDMATDYERDAATLGPLKTEPPRNKPERQAEPHNERGIFTSFRPIVGSQERKTMAAEPADAPDLHQGVRRYARSIMDIDRMRDLGLPILPHQVQAWERAGAALDALAPQAARDLDRAFERDPPLVREAAAGRAQRAIRAMRLEAEIRTDPNLRADRFVERWQGLERQRARLERGGEWQSERTIRDHMGAMAKSLERDPQVESILRNRSRELGIGMDMGRGIGRDLLDSLGLGRRRGLGI